MLSETAPFRCHEAPRFYYFVAGGQSDFVNDLKGDQILQNNNFKKNYTLFKK